MPQVHIPEAEQHEAAAYVWRTHAPEISAAAANLSRTVYERSNLSLREFEGARARIALINGCQVCINWRAQRDMVEYLASTGGDPDRAVSLRGGEAPDEAYYQNVTHWRTSPLYNARERLAIEYAERIALDHHQLDDDFWQRAHALFSDGEIVDMTWSIVTLLAMGRFTRTLDLDGACRVAAPQRAAA